MKVEKKLISSFGCWCVALAVTVTAFGRDPFFPLGYEIKKEVTPAPAPTITVQPVLPSVNEKKPVAAEEWDAARKALQVNGFASAGNNRQVVLIGGKSYRGGEKISITYQGVVFTWRVEIPEERKFNLVPLEAVRL